MANNRLWLVSNENPKDKILLAKYYPSTGWYFPWSNNQSLRLEEGPDFFTVFNKMLDKVKDFKSINDGDTPWYIEYEC